MTTDADGRRIAPAASRNAGPIGTVLAQVLPSSGQALELASGSGQHVAEWAARFPGLIWRPSDGDAGNLASIRAWADHAARPNLLAPQVIDACAPGWAAEIAGRFDLVLVVNLLHLVAEPGARILLEQAAQALTPGGLLAVYGPFLRAGRTTSDGDTRFDAEIRARDPRLGYKDAGQVQAWMTAAGLVPRVALDMPANNLFLLADRPNK